MKKHEKHSSVAMPSKGELFNIVGKLQQAVEKHDGHINTLYTHVRREA